MVVYTLEQRWEILRHYFENHGNVTECVRNSMFCALLLKIALSAVELWPPRSCDLTPLDYYVFGAIKDKCYADKLETIDA